MILEVWVPPCKLSSRCNYNLKKHPYGEQTCSLQFGSWTFDSNGVDMQFYDNVCNQSTYQRAISAIITLNSLVKC